MYIYIYIRIASVQCSIQQMGYDESLDKHILERNGLQHGAPNDDVVDLVH